MTIINIRTNMAQPVAEGGSAFLTWDLLDENGDPINLAQLGTLIWTHYDEATGDIANGRNLVNIKNANGGVVDAISGECSLTLTPGDNAIVDQTNRTEWKVAFIKATYNGGVGIVEKEIGYRVINLRYVP